MNCEQLLGPGKAESAGGYAADAKATLFDAYTHILLSHTLSDAHTHILSHTLSDAHTHTYSLTFFDAHTAFDHIPLHNPVFALVEVL